MSTMKCELLGKGAYKSVGIPDELTLKSLPTISELDYASGDEFDKILVTSILPKSIEEGNDGKPGGIDFGNLLEIDFQWVCRQLRIHNYGPYHTASAIYCGECGTQSYGEYQVDLRTIGCKQTPNGFKNEFTLSRDEFIDFNGSISFRIPTIKTIMQAYKDQAFQTPDGRINRELARICYTIYDMGGKVGLTPIEIKLAVESDLSSADYIILRNMMVDVSDYGLRAGGVCTCPSCGYEDAGFLGLSEDRFLRPTLSDLKAWKELKVKEAKKS